MTGASEFDVIVIGAGPAGENAAGRVSDAGLTTAIIEKELVGGECSYWGCMPSKALIRPGDALAAARRVPGVSGGEINPEAAFARRDYITGDWKDEGAVPWLESKKVTLFRGVGRLAGPKAVAVTGASGQVTVLKARVAVVLATGTTAVVPAIAGLEVGAAWNNRDVTSTSDVPERLIVLGGGAVGVEMAQAFKRLGSAEVTVVEGSDRLLAREERFAGAELREAFEQEGIRVLTGTKMTEAHRAPDGTVRARLEDGTTIGADEILIAVGRAAATTDLGVESVGLESGRPVAVDQQLRATGVNGQWLFAVGDCNGLAMLTHVGKYQARIAADVIAGKDVVDVVSHHFVPRVTFTDPQVCAAGLTEAEATRRGLDVKTVQVDMSDVAGATVFGLGVAGTAKLVIDGAREVIVGATITGPDVQEMLHAATIAIAAEIPLGTLWHAVPAFPTRSEVWLRLLEQYGL